MLYILFQYSGLKDAKKQLNKGYKDLKIDKVEVSNMISQKIVVFNTRRFFFNK